jgi:hypothetical protein
MSSYKRLRIWMLAPASLLESIQNSRRARRDAGKKKETHAKPPRHKGIQSSATATARTTQADAHGDCIAHLTTSDQHNRPPSRIPPAMSSSRYCRSLYSFASWRLGVSSSLVPSPPRLGVNSQPRYDRSKSAGLTFAYFDLGLGGVIHDEQERASSIGPDLFDPTQVD